MSIKPVYCHFSFRRPKGKKYGIFACACYGDKDGKKLVAHKTEMYTLWLDHQHVTAVQSYWFALKCLYDWQDKMIEAGVTNILLVCNNSNLVNLIASSKKNGLVAAYLEDAYMSYMNGNKIFELPIGICEAVSRDGSIRFCKEELVTNSSDYEVKVTLDESKGVARLDLGESAFTSIDDLLQQDSGYNKEPEEPDLEPDFDGSEIKEDSVIKLDWSV